MKAIIWVVSALLALAVLLALLEGVHLVLRSLIPFGVGFVGGYILALILARRKL